MNSLLQYVFYPNPGYATYTTPTQLALLLLSLGLIALSFGLRQWRRKLQNPITKKLSSGWPSAVFWFGVVGIVLVVSRVEHIQYLAMRFMWLPWFLAVLGYVFLQVRLYRAKHYEILPKVVVNDPRDKYLPTKKKH